MKHSVGGWIGVLLGCITLLGIDHWLRRHGHFSGLGDENMKLGLALIAAAAAIVWYRGLSSQPLPLRIALVGMQLAAGYLIVLGLAIGYACMTGLGCIV